MNKFARVVFEEEIPEDAQIPEIIETLKTSIKNWLKFLEDEPLKALEDVEMSNCPYERME